MKSNLFVILLATFLPTLTSCQKGSPSPADLDKIKKEIQAAEHAFGKAFSAKDLDALAAMYTDDAISMADQAPMMVGRDAIRKNMERDLSRMPNGFTAIFETLDVYGDANTVTETGKATYKDSAGKTFYTAKYISVWQKQGGKYLIVRDIYNGDRASAPAGYKSLHLFDLPQDMTEADLTSMFNKMNAAVERLGYPGAGYFLYKTLSNDAPNYRYYFEGVWPSEATYKAIYDDAAFKKAAEETNNTYQKIKAVEIYRKMVRVD